MLGHWLGLKEGQLCLMTRSLERIESKVSQDDENEVEIIFSLDCVATERDFLRYDARVVRKLSYKYLFPSSICI
jgi:hypothetical protein